MNGYVDFSRPTHKQVARLKRIVRKQGVSASIEMLDAFRYGKINVTVHASWGVVQQVKLTYTSDAEQKQLEGATSWPRERADLRNAPAARIRPLP